MRRFGSFQFETSSNDADRSGFLEELRESFTGSFAYESFQWIAFPQSSRIDFMAFVHSRLAKTGRSEDAGAIGLYTTDNSDIALYTVGEVVPVEGDAGILPQTNTSGPLVAIDDFRVDARFAGIDGSGYTIAVLDTGIDLDDPFFGPDTDGNNVSDRIVYQYDFANGDNNASDFNGHGSNVSSIAASSDGTYTGMAPGAGIAALKVFTDAGAGNFGFLEDALQWVIANAAAYNIVSVNMSLSDGRNFDTPVQLYGIADELATLAAMDVIVVSASGNAFYGLNSIQGVAYPSADPNSLSVGAVYDGNVGGFSYGSGAVAYSTTADRITPFSQRDDQLSDIFAPGAPITGAGQGSGLVTMHGTSQAAPHIAGIIALAQQLADQELGRKLTYDEIAQLLASTGDTIIDGDDEDDNVTNTGLAFQRVNVLALGEAILAMAPATPPREPSYFEVAAVETSRPEGDSGSTVFSFQVTRSGDLTAADTIDYTVTGSGADPAGADDFLGGGFPSGSVTFAADETSRIVTIQVAGDSEVETDESFALTISNAPPNGQILVASAETTIENDDAPPPGGPFVLIDADFAGSAETDGFTFVAGAFGGTTNPAYTRGAASGSDITVLLGGSDNADIFDMSGGWQRSFTLDGEMEVTLSFLYTLTQDSNYESDEFSQVLYSLNGGAAQLVDQITGNGNGGPDQTTGPQSFVVSLGVLPAGAHSIILGGYNNKKTYNNELTEIRFDDVLVTGIPTAAPPPPTTSFAIAADAAADQDEGDSGATAFTFTVTRSGDTTAAGSVDYAVSGAAVDSADFVGGVLPNGTVNFLAGQTTQALTIDVQGDSDVEGDEAFTVTLSNPSAGATITTASAGGTIRNDDSTPPPGPLVVIDESFDGGSGDFIYADGSFGGANPQSYADGAWQAGALTIDLGGIDGADIIDMSGGWTTSFTLAAESEVSLAFLYELIQTADYESDEFSQVLVRLDGDPAILVDSLTGNGNGGGVLTTGTQTYNAVLGVLAAGSHSLTIGGFNNKKTFSNENTELTLDDVVVTATPTAPIDTLISISAEDPILNEGDGGSTLFAFAVSRTGDLTGASSVDYSVIGAGSDPAEGDDFLSGLLPAGTVDFLANEASKTIVIEIAGDTDFEGDEAFTVVLSNPSTGNGLETATASSTIANDDPLPAGPVILVDANFDAPGDTSGFSYSDGVFGGAAPQTVADGSWSNGSLTVGLGGGANTTVTDISGAWEIDFDLAIAMDVTLGFSYELILAADYEADEFSQVLVSIDGGAPLLIDEIIGNGNGGIDQTTGLQNLVLDLGSLAAGSHSLAIGGYNNKKTWSNETTEITIDDVLVTGTVPSGASMPDPGGLLVGNDPLGIGNAGLSENELLSTAGI